MTRTITAPAATGIHEDIDRWLTEQPPDECGGCSAPETCGGGGTPNQCGCLASLITAKIAANGLRRTGVA